MELQRKEEAHLIDQSQKKTSKSHGLLSKLPLICLQHQIHPNLSRHPAISPLPAQIHYDNTTAISAFFQ